MTTQEKVDRIISHIENNVYRVEAHPQGFNSVKRLYLTYREHIHGEDLRIVAGFFARQIAAFPRRKRNVPEEILDYLSQQPVPLVQTPHP